MQDASNNLAAAVTGDELVFEIVVEADWDVDGYNGTDTIDDISSQTSDIAINQGLFDGLPDEVAILNSTGTPELSGTLGGGDATDGRPLSATQYWSPRQPLSPLYGKTRDIVPCRVSVDIVTAGGVERVRLFTGLILDTPIPASGRAKLSAVSLTRLRLSELVQLPVIGDLVFPSTDLISDVNTTTTWAISWILQVCGIQPGPPAIEGAFKRFPCHGGAAGFHTGGGFFGEAIGYPWDRYTPNPSTTDIQKISVEPPGLFSETGHSWPGGYKAHPLELWIPGPFAGAANAYAYDNARYLSFGVVVSDPGNPMISPGHSKGRLECYLLGTDKRSEHTLFQTLWVAQVTGTIYNNTAASPTPGLTSSGVPSYNIQAKIVPNTRVFSVTYTAPNGTTASLTHHTTFPNDGLWHSLGVAWDLENGRLWLELDGDVDTANNLSMSLSGAGGAGAGFGRTVRESGAVSAIIPIAEIQATQVTPDVNPTWQGDEGWWTQTADLFPSTMPIGNILDTQAREAYQLIQTLARADLSNIHIDEHDVITIRGSNWFATPEGQTVQETITAARHTDIPDLQSDVSRIRNVVRVSYTRRDKFATTNLAQFVLLLQQSVEILPGTFDYSFNYDIQTVTPDAYSWGRNIQFDILTATQLANLISGSLVLAPYTNTFLHAVFLNTSQDGTGSVVTTGVTLTIKDIYADHFVLTIANTGTSSVYISASGQLAASNGGGPVPFMYVVGMAVFPQDTYEYQIDDESLAIRGPRTLVATSDYADTSIGAAHLAQMLARDLADPLALVRRVSVFGNPLRQPGDLVKMQDPDETGLDAYMRLYAVKHMLDAGKYTQELQAVETKLVGTWADGVSRWGSCLWAGRPRAAIAPRA